jgi:dTDP-4-amino-4,6-dideoxy-D-galactose acyltransferase
MTNAIPTTASSLEITDANWGRVVAQRLDWDCEFFGREFAIITELNVEGLDRKGATAALLGELSRQAADRGYTHLTLRSPADDWERIYGAQIAEFSLVDFGIDFIKRVDSPVSDSSGMRLSRDEDLPALRELAASAFVHNRFAVDRAFSDREVRAFHREWVTNLHRGLAKAVLITEHGGEIAGFVACALQGGMGRIPLIAVQEKARGVGVGSALVKAALAWFSAAGATEVRVKTQVTNVNAAVLYERNGFVLDRAELTLTRALSGSGN